MQWSDPVREEELNQYVSHTRQVIAESHFKEFELSLHQKRRHDELMHKTTSRKRIKPTSGGMGITKEDALKAIEGKRQKEEELAIRKERNNFMRGWRIERDELQAKGVIARKAEKARLKRVKNYTKRGVLVPDEDATPIVDPEMEWKAINPTWKEEEARKVEAKKRNKIRTNQSHDDEEDVEFIIDIVGDSNLRDAVVENDDFVAFDETDGEEDVQRELGGGRRPVFDTITETMTWL